MPIDVLNFTFEPQNFFEEAKIREVFEKKLAMTFGSGLDGTTPQKFSSILDAEIAIILKKVPSLEYNFTRFREKLIVRAHDKLPRQIAIPTVRDKLVLRLLHEELKSYFIQTKHERPQKIIYNIKEVLSEPSLSKFIRIDIQKFFPSIDHGLLMSALKEGTQRPDLINLVDHAITNEIGSSGKSEVGVPQGLSVSNILAEIYLKEFDQDFKKFCVEKGCHYFRYVDDILVLAPEDVAENVFKTAAARLKDKKLDVHPLGQNKNKSSITNISDNSPYLGYELSNSGVRVKQESLQRMFNNVHKAITRFKYDKDEHERNLFRLNLKISGCVFQETKLGWLHFFSEIDKTAQLHHLDDLVNSKIKGRLPDELKSKVKSFVRAYFEITHNHYQTEYIPNFDNSDSDYKVKIIAMMTKKSEVEVDTWDSNDIDREFAKLINLETKKLEADIISLS